MEYGIQMYSVRDITEEERNGSDMEERKCPQCGAQADPNAKVCIYCGTPLEEAAGRARAAVGRAMAALAGGLTPDAVLTDAEGALDALGELTGRTAREEIVSRIFSRFCVGK